MADLALDLFALDGMPGDARERVEQLYEKLHGLCKWFEIGINGVLFPVEEGEPHLNRGYHDAFLADRRPDEQERLAQFFAGLRHILREHAVAYEGTFEVLPKEHAERGGTLRVAYVWRPFWKWY